MPLDIDISTIITCRKWKTNSSLFQTFSSQKHREDLKMERHDLNFVKNFGNFIFRIFTLTLVMNWFRAARPGTWTVRAHSLYPVPTFSSLDIELWVHDSERIWLLLFVTLLTMSDSHLWRNISRLFLKVDSSWWLCIFVPRREYYVPPKHNKPQGQRLILKNSRNAGMCMQTASPQ